MKKRNKVWVDELHGLRAVTKSRTAAWYIIRAKCIREGLKVPTVDKIKQEGEY